MKFSVFFSLLILSVIFVACGGPEGAEVESGEAKDVAPVATAATAFKVDASQSVINWKGSKLIGSGHEGKVSITNGRLAVANNNIVGGDFIIDMTSLENTDLDADGKGKLEGHLKSADFFDVEQFPTAKFVIIGAQPMEGGDGTATHQVTGNLTMRGQTRSIAIPVLVTMEGEMLKAVSPDFVIDRTEWGVAYGSEGSVADLAKDKIINDNIGLQIHLVAKK